MISDVDLTSSEEVRKLYLQVQRWPWSMIDTEACGAGSRRDFDLAYLSRVTDTRGEFYISRIYGPWVIYTIFCAEKVHVEENCFRRLRHASQYFTVTIGSHAVQISMFY